MIDKNALLRANEVLAILENMTRGIDEPWYIGAYANGRENGYCLTHGMNQVCFSEFRRSDAIVVYFGTRTDFDLSSNIPNEETYQHAEFFHDARDAANFIYCYFDGPGDEDLDELKKALTSKFAFLKRDKGVEMKSAVSYFNGETMHGKVAAEYLRANEGKGISVDINPWDYGYMLILDGLEHGVFEQSAENPMTVMAAFRECGFKRFFLKSVDVRPWSYTYQVWLHENEDVTVKQWDDLHSRFSNRFGKLGTR